jgi:hypothetical protein
MVLLQVVVVFQLFQQLHLLVVEPVLNQQMQEQVLL